MSVMMSKFFRLRMLVIVTFPKIFVTGFLSSELGKSIPMARKVEYKEYACRAEYFISCYGSPLLTQVQTACQALLGGLCRIGLAVLLRS